MSVYPRIRFNERGYSQIIYAHDGYTRYRIIRNPSFLTQLYYWTFVDSLNEIHVTLWPWDGNIADVD